MENTYHYIYCPGLLGVRTNRQDFKWVYGSAAPDRAAADYESCAVQLDVRVLPERQLEACRSCDKRFQAYAWDEEKKTIYYRRKLFSRWEIGYNIRICGSRVEAQIGERYYRFVRNRVMNLHGIYYLLADLANLILLQKGYLTLYGSAVSAEKGRKGLVFFAPPNTGKTVTAVKLCENAGCSLIGEDVILTDGEQLYGCPWTNSYRKQGGSADSAGAFGRTGKPQDLSAAVQCDLTDLFVLSLGKEKAGAEKEEVLRQMGILNGYLFQYYSSPIVKVLGYFDSVYAAPWNVRAEAMLAQMADRCSCCMLQEEEPLAFWSAAVQSALGENR